MKCFKHSADAVGVCAYCGRALCRECIASPDAPRLVCSNDCAAALAKNERTLESILRRGAQSAKASAMYCYVSAGLSAAAAVVAWFMLPSPFLIFFAGGCAVVLLASGIYHSRGAKTEP